MASEEQVRCFLRVRNFALVAGCVLWLTLYALGVGTGFLSSPWRNPLMGLLLFFLTGCAVFLGIAVVLLVPARLLLGVSNQDIEEYGRTIRLTPVRRRAIVRDTLIGCIIITMAALIPLVIGATACGPAALERWLIPLGLLLILCAIGAVPLSRGALPYQQLAAVLRPVLLYRAATYIAYLFLLFTAILMVPVPFVVAVEVAQDPNYHPAPGWRFEDPTGPLLWGLIWLVGGTSCLALLFLNILRMPALVALAAASYRRVPTGHGNAPLRQALWLKGQERLDAMEALWRSTTPEGKQEILDIAILLRHSARQADKKAVDLLLTALGYTAPGTGS